MEKKRVFSSHLLDSITTIARNKAIKVETPEERESRTSKLKAETHLAYLKTGRRRKSK